MVFEKVQGILADQLDLDADDITMESSLTEDLGADSLDFVDIVMSLEDEFDAEFPEEDMEGVKTVGDVVRYIEENIL
ncbi:MAG: acyl carrier protein [Clostridiales bacterium]|nr:acyl carrier protein [Clostridiales bacterium]